RTADGQLEVSDLYASFLVGATVVLFDPGDGHFAGMPGSVVPHHDQPFLPFLGEHLGEPLQERDRVTARRAAFREPDQDLFRVVSAKAVTANGDRVRVLRLRLKDMNL